MSQLRRRPPGRPRFDENQAPIADTIMKMATKLFMDFGYEGVSVDQVAKACGVTKATVYYHYHNKAALFTQAVVDLMNRIRSHTIRVLEMDMSLEDRLVRIAELRLNVPHAVHNFESLMSEAELMLSEEQLQAMRDAELLIAQAIADDIQKAMDGGEIRTVDAMFVSHAYLALLMVGKSKKQAGDPLFDSPREAAVNIVSLLFDGIRNSK